MENRATIFRRYLACFSFFILLFAISRPLAAQDPIPVDEDGNPLASTTSELLENNAIEASLPLFTIAELQEFVGPVALYPDNLLAIILPASTYPLQIVLAARFLEQLETDGSLEPDEGWDESVIALLNYPEVVQMMNEDIQWTWQLGEAVVSQETDVLTAIGTFRDLAYAAGNLQSDEYQNVTPGEKIVITQVEETVVYVPYYVPEEVVVYQTRPVYHYYPTAYPVYYYPYPASYRFRSGFFWGVTTAFNIGWHDYHLHVYHPSYSRHPYYGRLYASRHHYRRPDIRAFNHYYVDNSYRRSRDRDRDGSYWRPQRNSGARPDDWRYRNRNFEAANQRTAFNDIGANRDNRNNRGNRPNGGNGPNRGIGGSNNRRDSVIDPSARNGFAENNVETANAGVRTSLNERQGERGASTNRGAGRLRPDRSLLVGNNTDTTRSNARTQANETQRNNGSNNERGTRSDRSTNAAITNNRQGSQRFQEPGSRESGEFNLERTREAAGQRTSDSNGTVLTATPSGSSIKSTQATDRLRLQNTTNRSPDKNRQRQVNTENRQSSQLESNARNSRLIRRESVNSNRTRQQSPVAPANQNTRSITRADSVRNQVRRGQQRVAPAESSSRQVREAPRRQSSAPRPARTEPVRRSEPSRSTRSSAPDVSRSAPKVSRQSNGDNRGRERRQRP